MIYLLDTNTCVEYLRQRNARIRHRLASTNPADVRLCSVVKTELIFGALRSRQAQTNLTKLAAFVQQFVSLPFDDSAAEEHARIRAHLADQGLPIGPYDSQIATIAKVNQSTLVTHNTREFSRVPGLNLEDWSV
jgi:tRNA(fMet)-specific endonuclease VapC